MVQFSLVVVEKFRKGTDVRSLGTFASKSLAEQQRSQIKFAGKRGQPFIIPTSEVSAFVSSRRTGIFRPKFDPIKARIEEAAKIRRQKEQQSFERLRAAAKEPTRAGVIARIKIQSKFGITARQRELTQKEFVERRTLEQLRTGTTLTQFKTLREIEIERGRAVVTRARKVRKVQLRKVGAEVIFKPSRKFFGVVPTGEGVKAVTKIPTETELVRELKAQKGFVTFVAPKKPEKKVEISVFRPEVIEVKEPKFTPEGRIGKVEGGLRERFGIERGKAEAKARRLQREGKTASAIFLQIGILGVSGAKGFVEGRTAPFRPQFFKDLFKAVTKPGETFGGLGAELRIRPASILGEFIGFGKGFGVTTRTIGKFVLKPGVTGAAITEFKPQRVKGFEFAAERVPLVSKEFTPKKLAEAVRLSTKLAQEEVAVVKPKISKGAKLELTISDTGKITTKVLEKPKPPPTKIPDIGEPILGAKSAITQFQKLAEKDIGATKFKGIAGIAREPKGGAKKLAELVSGKQKLILIQEEQFVGVRGITKQVPKIEFKFPSVTKIRTVGILRLTTVPVSLLQLKTPTQIQLGISKQKQITVTKPILMTKTDARLKQILEQQLKTRQLTQQEQLTRLRALQRLEPLVILKPIQEVKVLQATKLTQLQEPLLIPKLKPPGLKPPFILFPLKKKGKVEEKPAFTTEVREGERKGDKFFRVRKQTLPRQRAINLGARIADNTTARTFRIKRKGKTTLPDTKRFPLKDKFRGRIGKSKLPPKVFVEKSKFAIDSPGERLGIPFSPLRIPRLKAAQERKRARKIPKPLTTGRGRTRRFL